MRVIIVDDESDILLDIKDTIQEYEGFDVVGTYINPLDVLPDIRKTKPECAFLDIEMPGMNGIDLAEKLLELNPKMEIVFITAFNHYATQAFEVNAMDYVLKPVHPIRLKKTIERLRQKRDEMWVTGSIETMIHSLGCFEVLLDGKSIKWNRSKSKELLAYLLHFEGQRKTKYKLCEDLWPEYEPKKGLVNLQTAMCSLRKSLGDMGREDIKIVFSEESYILKLGKVVWDASEFEKLYNAVKENGDISLLQKAVALYQGDYMGNEDWIWAQLTAESFSRKYQEILKILAEKSFQAGRFNETVEVIMKLAKKQAIDIELQKMLAEAAFHSNGISGLNHQINILRKLYKNEYDMDIDSEILAYCSQKGVEVQI